MDHGPATCFVGVGGSCGPLRWPSSSIFDIMRSASPRAREAEGLIQGLSPAEFILDNQASPTPFTIDSANPPLRSGRTRCVAANLDMLILEGLARITWRSTP